MHRPEKINYSYTSPDSSTIPYHRDTLIVERILRVGQIKHNTRVRLSSTTVRKFLAKVNRAVEGQAAILIDVNVERLEVGRGVDDPDLARLNEVVGDDQVLLVGRDFDVVRSHSGLVLVGVIETLGSTA